MSALVDRSDAPGRGGWRALVGLGRRAELSVWAVIGILLVVVATATAVLPRLLVESEQSSLDQAIAGSTESQRRLTVRLIGQFGQGTTDDPLAEQRQALTDAASRIDDALLSRYGDATFIVDSSRFEVAEIHDASDQPSDQAVGVAPPLPTFITFRTHPELDEYSRLIAGRAAAPSEGTLNGMDVFEFELARDAATELGWELGDTFVLASDPTDTVTRQQAGSLPDRFMAELVGLRELSPRGDPYWHGDARLHRPSVVDTHTGANLFVFGSIAPSQLPGRPFAVDQFSPFFVEQRRAVVDGGITLDNFDETLDGLQAVESTFAAQPTVNRPGAVAGLGPVLELERDQRRTAKFALVLAAAGVISVAMVTLAQLVAVAAARRRGWMTIARARGASARQVVGAAVAEMVAVAALATAVGWLLVATVAGGSTPLGNRLLGALWIASVATAGAVAWNETRRPVSVDRTVAPSFARVRRVGGVLVVVISVASVVTFRRRGVGGDSLELDPLVVLLPIIVPLAVVAIARWSLPVAFRRLASGGMALGPGRLIGYRRAADSPGAWVGLLAVFVLSLTVAALGLAMNRSLARGSVDASWVAVGAPYRVDTRDVDLAEQIGVLPDVTVAASGSTRINVIRDGDGFNVQLTTVDVPAARRLTAGTAADLDYPTELDEPELSGRVPIVSSNRIGGGRVERGDVFTGVGAPPGTEFLVVETRPEAFGRQTDWILIDRSVYGSAIGREPGFNSLAIDLPAEGLGDLEALVAAGDERLLDRVAVLEVQRDDPLSRAVRGGYLIAGMLAVLLALVALVAISVMTARQRRREVSILGLLGADDREIARAVASELLPTVAASVVIGSFVGWFVVRLYDGRFDVSSFAAGSAVPIRPDPLGVLLAGAGLAATSGVLVAVVTRRIMHARVREILRIEGAA